MSGHRPGRAGGSATSVIMPAFGKNVHVQMTNWLPSDASQAQAVLTDKDYELAYLYAEYTSGQDTSWTGYVSPTMQTEVQTALSQPRRHRRVLHRDHRLLRHERWCPTRPSAATSTCPPASTTRRSSNTNAQTGKVIPDTTSRRPALLPLHRPAREEFRGPVESDL